MQNKNYIQGKDEQPTFSLIQQIRDGTVAPETLTKELRQRCVEVLFGEGYAVAAMAQILKKSEKTIRRDREDIRERNAISPDINLAKKIVGEFLVSARINQSHLVKLARSKEASVSEKVQSEYYAFKVFAELITKLQSLGYLPTKPQAIVSDIFHHVGEESSDFDDFAREIIEIEKMADDGDVEGGIKENITKMKMVLEKIQSSEKDNNQKEKKNEDTKE